MSRVRSTYEHTGAVRVEIHVRPGASKTSVGGEYNGALIVRVVEPPDRGRATSAVLTAIAEALSMSPTSVTLVRGVTSRRKLIEIEVEASQRERVDALVARLLRQL
jgi:uncharacterized protein YggU (UPF0235/DUF167 family)